jgi:putative FmdB family regulatory protein
MPTYEYRCPKGHRFDVFQKMSDPPVAKCPECGQPGERMISPGAGFLFKGEGFYITDYRSEDYKKKKAGEQPPAVASPGKSDASAKSSGGGESSPKSEKAEKSEPKTEKKESKKEPKKGSKRGGDE